MTTKEEEEVLRLCDEMTDTTKQAEPVAWMNPNGIGSVKYMDHGAKMAWTESCGEKCHLAKIYTEPLYTHPAPALTVDLKAELLECLRYGEISYKSLAFGVHMSEAQKECAERLNKISAAITKLTNLECGS